MEEKKENLHEDIKDFGSSEIKNSKDITCIIVTHKKAALDICNRHIQINDKIL